MESERKYSSLSFSILKRGWSITWVIFHLNFLQIEIGHGCMLYLVFGGQLSHMPLADGVGSWSFYIVFFAVDYITGCAASLKEKKGLKSTIGFWGLFKKGLILLMVFMVHRIDIALGTNFGALIGEQSKSSETGKPPDRKDPEACLNSFYERATRIQIQGRFQASPKVY
jgi:Phage-related holin (Lysis protein)